MAESPVLCEEPQPVPRMDATKACTTTRCQNNKYSSNQKIWNRWIGHVMIRLIFVLIQAQTTSVLSGCTQISLETLESPVRAIEEMIKQF